MIIEDQELIRLLDNAEDLEIIKSLYNQIQLMADASQADVFIDCLIPGKDAAMVVAEAHPRQAKSLYKKPVAGQVALKEKEPGVIFCLKSGREVIGSRGISQENVHIQQNVVPILNNQGKTIGILVIESDISDKVQQEKNVEKLMETTEQLSETLFDIGMSKGKIPSLIHEGLLIFDHHHVITYANERAYQILNHVKEFTTLVGENVNDLSFNKISKARLLEHEGVLFEEVQINGIYIQYKAVEIHRNDDTIGGILLLRDLTEIREKEKQLMIKSAVIKEIHHRVKNNLQTIVSLLRIQMRRSSSEEIEKVFQESINRITSISIIHEVLSQDGLNRVDCKEIFEYVVRALVSSMKKSYQKIDVTITGQGVYLNSEKASTLALIINELVQNSIQHAFTADMDGSIHIHIYNKNEFIIIEITDDGVGFSYEPEQFKGSLGLEICHTLATEDLNGLIEFQNPGKGTRITITFPLPKEES